MSHLPTRRLRQPPHRWAQTTAWSCSIHGLVEKHDGTLTAPTCPVAFDHDVCGSPLEGPYPVLIQTGVIDLRTMRT